MLVILVTAILGAPSTDVGCCICTARCLRDSATRSVRSMLG